MELLLLTRFLNKKVMLLLIVTLLTTHIYFLLSNKTDYKRTESGTNTTMNGRFTEGSDDLLAQQQKMSPEETSIILPMSGSNEYQWVYMSAKVNETLYKEVSKEKAATCKEINQFIQDQDVIAMQGPPLMDILKAANASRSRVILNKNSSHVEFGSHFTATVTVHDGYGNRIRRGGDTVRARMFSTSLGAYSTGMVSDNKDGTYTVTFTALWVGTVELEFSVAYSREAIRALHFQALRDNFRIDKYGSKNMTEFTLCVTNQSERDRIKRLGYKSICNHKEDSLFCGKPWHTECSNQKGETNYTNVIYTKDESELLLKKNWNKLLPKTIQLQITGSGATQTVSRPNRPCTSFKTANLWNFDQPAGFFYKDKWVSSHCYGGPDSEEQIAACLKNIPVYLFGDSTVQQWYEFLTKLLKCPIHTHLDAGKNEKRKPVRSCTDENREIFIANIPHDRDLLQSDKSSYPHLSTFLDRIPADEGKAIILIHMYAHFDSRHASLFHERFHMARLSIEKLLERRPNIKIFVKGPHTFQTLCWIQSCTFTVCDYFAEYFRKIIQMEFRGLFEKIIFLDFLEMSSAIRLTDIHPNNYFIKENIQYMLGFICQ